MLILTGYLALMSRFTLMKIHYLLSVIALAFSINANADDSSTLDAAIGGGIGGAVGAAIGNEVGGRDAAIIGGGIGGAVGTAINTDEGNSSGEHHESGEHYEYRERHDDHHNDDHFCPPGQAKKGRC